MRIHLATNMWRNRCNRKRRRRRRRAKWTKPLSLSGEQVGRGTRTHGHSRSHWLSLAVRRDGRDEGRLSAEADCSASLCKRGTNFELLIFLKRIANVGEKRCQARWQPASERQLRRDGRDAEGFRRTDKTHHASSTAAERKMNLMHRTSWQSFLERGANVGEE